MRDYRYPDDRDTISVWVIPTTAIGVLLLILTYNIAKLWLS